MTKKSKAEGSKAVKSESIGLKNGVVKNDVEVKQKLSEIDDLFASAKEKKKRTIEEAAIKGKTVSSSSSQNINKKRKKLRAHPAEIEEEDIARPFGVVKSGIKDPRYQVPMSVISPEAPLERIDKVSGLPVYKAHLLRVGEGGGTALCPFDCDCCF